MVQENHNSKRTEFVIKIIGNLDERELKDIDEEKMKKEINIIIDEGEKMTKAEVKEYYGEDSHNTGVTFDITDNYVLVASNNHNPVKDYLDNGSDIDNPKYIEKISDGMKRIARKKFDKNTAYGSWLVLKKDLINFSE